MVSKIFLLLTLALAATSAPLDTRQEPKPAKGFGGFGSSRGSRGSRGSGTSSAPSVASSAAASSSSSTASNSASGSTTAAKGSESATNSGGSRGSLSSAPVAASSNSGSGISLTNLMGGGMTSSEIKKGDFSCKKAALIFARGTGEPGNMGYVVGPGLGTALKKALNNDVLLQGADYSTNFSGGGAKEMVTVVKMVMAKCPDTKIILGGYSQGAMQVHQALGSLGADAAKIAAAVTFGDPYSNMGWGSGGIVGAVMGLGTGPPKGTPGFDPANGAIFCSTGDFVCGVTPNIGGAVPKTADGKTSAGQIGGFGGGHISYMGDGSIGKAVAFILSKVN